MTRLPPHSRHRGRPVSPHTMAKRLRTRLRLARVAIEREIGHPIATVVPHASQQSPQRNAAPLLRSLAARAHSYSHGDFPALYRDPAPALESASSSSLLRYQSALPAATAQSASALRSRQPGTAPTAMLPLDIPSSPPDAPRTPRMRPLDYESEAAHTILMLATPPAARAPPPLSVSPCRQASIRRYHSPTTQLPNRRLSFTKCAPPLDSPRRSRQSEQTSIGHSGPPNLSQLTTSSAPSHGAGAAASATARPSQDSPLS
ncbi:hypothetical protein EV175_003205 [Coemansia sp. RSA 1933]|nr:hypothetical protein EV175_003205 [Coemansia sp. RSA 1933]